MKFYSLFYDATTSTVHFTTFDNTVVKHQMSDCQMYSLFKEKIMD